jgi:hypothetical protein
MRPDIVGGDHVVGRQVFGSLAGGSNLKAAGPRPIDQLADERRLVAIGERIDDALRPRLLGEQRPGEHVGFDIDHDDMFFCGDRGAGMGNARGRDPGCFDDDLDVRMPARLRARRDEQGFRNPRRVPTDCSTSGASAVGVEIGDDRYLEARHRRHLSQKHRTELAGANEPDLHRFPSIGALLRQAVEAHDVPRYSAAAR